jgi:SNF2 family DNA or RNA helicase
LDYFYLHKGKFLDENWFLDAFEEWKKQDILVLGFNELKNNNLNCHKAKVSVSVNSGIDWFNTSIAVRFGEQNASLKQLHKSIRNKSKYIQLDDGTVGILPEEWIKKFASYFHLGEPVGETIRTSKSNFSEVLQIYESEVLSKETEEELKLYETRFSEFERIQEVAVPSTLLTPLRDYQKHGLNWLNFLDEFNFGGCLADDMGLGKTIKIIAFNLSQRKKQKNNTNLVVVRTSLVFNWQDEVAKFAPSIQIHTNYGTARVNDVREFDNYEIVLTTYGMLLSDITVLKEYHFNYIFLDESQTIKNPESQRYKAARMLKSRNKIILTGTPVENNTFDIYGQISFACPGLLGNKQYFKDIYSIPIDKFSNSQRASELQKKISPFILRRTKKQVALELPDKTEMVIFCEMGEEQRRVYDRYEKELRDFIANKNEDDLAKNRMHVLTGITKLRQICNSPALLKEEDFRGEFSSKIDVLMEQIESKSTNHKILIFSQFVTMLDLIKKELVAREMKFEYLTGQTKDRASKVNGFQTDDTVRVFLISLKAGGTGLNLTEADYVYIVDPWWNPAVENQAIDRTHRIGQKNKVVAVRLICPDSIENKIRKLQESKTNLANDLIKTDASILKSLSKQDLIGLLR